MRIIFSILIGALIGNIADKYFFNSTSIEESKKIIIFELGRVYKICPPKKKDPFSKEEWHNVIISDTSGYYVQYFEVGKKEGPYFSRSCAEFQELINNCK